MRFFLAAFALVCGLSITGVARASGIFVDVTQNTLSEQLLDPATCDFQPCGGLTRTYTVTNNTGVAWDNFIFRIAAAERGSPDPAVPIISFLFVWDNLGSFQMNADNTGAKIFFTSPIIAGATMRFTMIGSETDNTVESFDVFGAANVPEPASMTLLVAGLVGLGVTRRRRAG